MTAPVRAIGVRFEAQGVPEVQAAVRSVQKATETLSTASQASMSRAVTSVGGLTQKYAQASLGIANATETMARMGKVSGEAGRQLITQAASIAFAFGPTGMIVGALGIATMAIVAMFTRTKREAKAAADAAVADFNRVAAGSASATRAQIGQLLLGDREVGENATNDQLGKLRLVGKSDSLAVALNNSNSILGIFSRRQQIQALQETAVAIATIDKRVGKYTEELERQEKHEAKVTAALKEQTAALEAKKKAIDSAKDAARRAAESDLKSIGLLFSVSGSRRPMSSDGSKERIDRIAHNLGYDSKTTLDTGLPTQGQLDKELARAIKDIEVWAERSAKLITETIQAAMRESYSKNANIIAGGLSSAVAAGIMAAMTNGDFQGAMKQWGDQMVGVLAQRVAEWAITAERFSTAMAKIQMFMTTHPWAAVAAAGALYLVARSLSRRGSSSMGSGGSGSGGGSLSGLAASASGGSDQVTRILWGADSTTVAAGMTPRQAINVTIIGPNDPSAGRAIQELIRNTARRGGG